MGILSGPALTQGSKSRRLYQSAILREKVSTQLRVYEVGHACNTVLLFACNECSFNFCINCCRVADAIEFAKIIKVVRKPPQQVTAVERSMEELEVKVKQSPGASQLYVQLFHEYQVGSTFVYCYTILFL
jgi:hypothetical protein